MKRDGWEECTLGDICKGIFAGGDVPKTVFSKERTESCCIPVFSNGVENEGLYGYTNIPRVVEPCVTISGRGTIGHTVLRSTPFFPIIRLIAAIPKDDVDIRYFFYAVSNIHFKSTGVTIPQLTVPAVKSYRFCYPVSKSEQQRIVDELDLLSRVIELKKAQLRTLDELAQSIFYEMFSTIKERTPLSTYVTDLSAGKSLAGDEESPNKVLKTGAVTYDYFRGDDVKNLPIDYQPKEKDLVRKGDLLISRMNTAELVGAVAYVWDVAPKVYLPDRLWRATLTEKANPIFLWKALIQFESKQQIRSLASGTSGTMKNISKPKFLSVEVPVVDRCLQDAFADRLRELERQKIAINVSKKIAQDLLASRMDKYFNE